MKKEPETREVSRRVLVEPKWIPVQYNGLPISAVDAKAGVVGRACHTTKRIQPMGRKTLCLTYADAHPITDLDTSMRDIRYVLEHARYLLAQKFGFFGGKYLTQNTYGIGVFGNTLIIHLKRFHDPVTFKAWVRAWKATVGADATVDFHYRHDMAAMKSEPFLHKDGMYFRFKSEDQIADAIREQYEMRSFDVVGKECAVSWRKWMDTAHVTSGDTPPDLPPDDTLESMLRT